MRRPLRSLAAAATLAAVVAACGGSDGDSASGCTPIASKLTVGAQDDLKFDAESYEADAGCLEVTYRNDGDLPHTLLVREQSGFKLSVGDTDTGTIDLPEGTYELFCDIAGHEAAGMKAGLTVS
jgi:plastocyanin